MLIIAYKHASVTLVIFKQLLDEVFVISFCISQKPSPIIVLYILSEKGIVTQMA